MEKCWLYDCCNKKDCPTDEEPNKFCLKKTKLDCLYNNSLLTYQDRFKKTLYLDSDYADHEEFAKLSNISANIVNFVENGSNLFIHSSNCGNGKTSWSIRMIQSYFNAIWPKAGMECKALFISVPKFLNDLKNNISMYVEDVNFIKENIFKADLVVWDDIAAKVGTEFDMNVLLSYIDGRIARHKSNIYTSNLNFNEMTVALGQRLASRICQYSIDVELHGKDKRSLEVNKEEVK